jgi:uncharacterized protein YjbI with pentapeptide repeats
MNKTELYNLIQAGSGIWRDWRKANPGEYIDISGLSFSGMDLEEFDFSNVAAIGTNFSNCDLAHANLSNADCSGANFQTSN